LRFEKAGMREVVTGIGVLHLVGQQVGLGVGEEGVVVLHMVGKQVGDGGNFLLQVWEQARLRGGGDGVLHLVGE
jgi:hypothetical protein